MTAKSSNNTRTAASNKKIIQIAKASVEAALQSQSSDNESLSHDVNESERSVQTDTAVGKTSKSSSIKKKNNKSLSKNPPSPISASPLRNDDDDEHTHEEGELSDTSEDRESVDHPIRKRSHSPSEEYFKEDDSTSNSRSVDEGYSMRDRSFSGSLLTSENRRSRSNRRQMPR
jgi:hypothetical protein